MGVVGKILLVSFKIAVMGNILLAMASLTPLRALADTGSLLRTLRLERNRTQEEVTARELRPFLVFVAEGVGVDEFA